MRCTLPLFAVSLFIGALPVYAVVPATPALQITKPIYEWKTENETDKKTKEFNHCLVKNMYDNGTVVMLAENNQNVQRLALHFPQSKMKAGEHFDLTLQVDKRDLFPVEAIAVSPQILTIGIPEALPDQMRKGQALYVRGPNDEVVYQLDGAEGAVLALRDCVSTNKYHKPSIDLTQDDTKPAPKQDTVVTAAKVDEKPVALPEPVVEPKVKTASAAKAIEPVVTTAKSLSAPTQAVPAKPAETTKSAAPAVPMVSMIGADIKRLAQKLPSLSQEKKIETYDAILPDRLHAIYAKADLGPDKLLLQPGDNPDSPLDYAWSKKNLLLGVKENKAVPAAGLPIAATSYLKMMKQRCSGSFVAEAALPSKDKDVTWLVAEAACSSGRGGDTIAALLFATDAQNMTIYFVEAPVKQGSDAIKARDTILNAVTK